MSKNKAVFLDRDGVINKNKINYVKTIEELEILPSIGISIKKLKNNDYFVIVITNQSPINRKLMTHEQLNLIHSSIQQHLESFDTSIDKFYFCPHMPQENCNCRKPKTGMLMQAMSEFNIEPTLSWMIGDNDSDIQAGLAVGCRTLRIDDNTNLQLAVDKILNS
jgi:histidinol-phosphate phosphatase family protein